MEEYISNIIDKLLKLGIDESSRDQVYQLLVTLKLEAQLQVLKEIQAKPSIQEGNPWKDFINYPQVKKLWENNELDCCANCQNNPKNNPLATGSCNCALPYMYSFKYTA
jgi:hypothetical protein